jgi:hypothetical protein
MEGATANWTQKSHLRSETSRSTAGAASCRPTRHSRHIRSAPLARQPLDRSRRERPRGRPADGPLRPDRNSPRLWAPLRRHPGEAHGRTGPTPARHRGSGRRSCGLPRRPSSGPDCSLTIIRRRRSLIGEKCGPLFVVAAVRETPARPRQAPLNWRRRTRHTGEDSQCTPSGPTYIRECYRTNAAALKPGREGPYWLRGGAPWSRRRPPRVFN